MQKPLLTTKEAAQILGVSESILRAWRISREVKIPFVKIGRAVRYRQEDLDSAIDRMTVKEGDHAAATGC